MGGGQNDIAIRYLKESAKKGNWLCLKNLHLVISWVSQLEQLSNLISIYTLWDDLVKSLDQSLSPNKITYRKTISLSGGVCGDPTALFIHLEIRTSINMSIDIEK